MRFPALLVAFLAPLFISGCGEQAPLPFPTPAQSELVVLVRSGPLTYQLDEERNASGLEHDLIDAFAQELGVAVRYIEASPAEIERRLAQGDAHFAATWFSPEEGRAAGLAFTDSQDVLAQNDASLAIDELDDLKGKTVFALAGSRQAAALKALRATVPDLTVEEFKDGDSFDLIDAVSQRRVELALVDSAMLDIALQFTPEVQATLPIGAPRPIAWQFPEHGNVELQAKAAAFLEKARQDGTLARITDRYLGHVRRLDPEDIATYIERIETVLPKLRKHFEAAQTITGIDWRLLAALAYHESNWNPNATSPTGVRGIMMLTEETADRLNVTNRLDPKESILAGARYLDYLKSTLPASTPEPDRTWLALSAYNIGPGHFNAARQLGRQLKADTDSWYEMKRIIPLLAQPKYYQRLKAGRARGGEAVFMTENIRSYYDILVRHEPAYRPISTLSDGGIFSVKPTTPGLKLR